MARRDALGLTKRQREVLEFIERCVADHGYPPTVRDINDQFGATSPNAAKGHLTRLRAKGFVDWTAGMARSLRVLRPVRRGIPLLTLEQLRGIKND